MQPAILFIAYIVVSLLLQTVALPSFPSAYVWTDWLFYLVVLVGLRFRISVGIILAIVLGYIVDALSFAPYGTTIISYVTVFICIRAVKTNIYIENRISLLFWVAVFSLLRQFVELVVLSIGDRVIDVGGVLVGRAILQAIWDGAVGMLIIPFIEKLLDADFAKVFRKKRLRYG